MRLLVVDPADRLLLFQDSDPVAGMRWWILPGGGIDRGETEVGAAVRELAEETGLRVDPAQVREPLARRRVLHGYSDQIVEQDDAFYLVRVPAFEVDIAGHTEDEKLTLQQHRWWTRTELAAAEGVMWPVLLPDLTRLAGEPDRWPVLLDDVEESSVPVTEADRGARGA